MSYQDLAAWPEDWRPFVKMHSAKTPDGAPVVRLAHVLFEVQHGESGEWIPVEYAAATDEGETESLMARLNVFIQGDARPGEFYVRHYRPDPNEPSRVLGWIPITHVKVRQ